MMGRNSWLIIFFSVSSFEKGGWLMVEVAATTTTSSSSRDSESESESDSLDEDEEDEEEDEDVVEGCCFAVARVAIR